MHYLSRKPAKLFIIFALLIACVSCAPSVSSRFYKMEAKTISDCVKGVAVNFISSHKDFSNCIASTGQTLTDAERGQLNNYLLTTDNSEMQLLTTGILPSNPPASASKQMVINAILQETESISNSSIEETGHEDEDEDEDEDNHDHHDHDH